MKSASILIIFTLLQHLIMKEAFYSKLDAYLSALNCKRGSKYVIKNETYDNILLVLLNEKKLDPSFIFWARKRSPLHPYPQIVIKK
jgi:hypothetical protein